jgi:hypothetical protein
MMNDNDNGRSYGTWEEIVLGAACSIAGLGAGWLIILAFQYARLAGAL